METITNEYFRNTWSMLIHLIQPAFNSLEAPLICDVINQQDALNAPGVGAQNGTESTLTYKQEVEHYSKS